MTSAAASVVLSSPGTLVLGTLFLPPIGCVTASILATSCCCVKRRDQRNLEKEFSSVCGSRGIRHHGAGHGSKGQARLREQEAERSCPQLPERGTCNCETLSSQALPSAPPPPQHSNTVTCFPDKATDGPDSTATGYQEFKARGYGGHFSTKPQPRS